MNRISPDQSALEHLPMQSSAASVAWKPVELQSWGRAQSTISLAARPERMRDLHAALQDGGEPGQRRLLARGAARSYGDACLNAGGAVILTERLNRILSFDPSTGLVVVEPGVTFRDLLDVFLPLGFRVPVAPGTAFVTMGGAVANDIHGKNQHADGCFGDHLEWLDLLCADGSVRRLSASQNSPWFDATIAGIGLTGIVVAVCLRLVAVASPALLVRRRRVGNLEEFLGGFEQADGLPFSVGWIDVLARGAALGRGILETGEPASRGALSPKAPRAKRLPVDFPGWALNDLSVRAFNALYWRGANREAPECLSSYLQFLHPLDAISGWNRLYGKRGFHQFQCVVPKADARRVLERLLAAAGNSGEASFLAVLKLMGQGGRGMLSFAQPGYTLALDFASGQQTEALFRTLEHITRDAGGRIYLAKDAMMSAESFAAMYPRVAEFQEIRAQMDPDRRFSSSMSRRLGLG